MEVSLPVIGSVLVNWTALWLTSRYFSLVQSIGMAILIPGVILGMALITTWDILRQCETDSLLAGIVPGVDVWSFVVGAIGILIPFGLFAWMGSFRVLPPWPYLAALSANFIILAGLSWFVRNSYRNIQ
jgi:CDP-diglyceride synthetase